MDCPPTLLEALCVEHTDEEGFCLHCGIYAAHAYGCPSQHARLLLGRPLLKTLIERQYEDAIRQREYTQWRREHPEEAAESDEIWDIQLSALKVESDLWKLIRSIPYDGPTEIQWVEEE